MAATLENELRFGSYVQLVQSYESMYKHDFKNRRILKIHTIHADMLASIFNGYSVSSIEPIQLTEEILTKCGFERTDSDNGFMLTVKNDWLYFYADIVYSYFELIIPSQTCQLDIKYLHQLQNLYFALTGKELEVSL